MNGVVTQSCNGDQRVSLSGNVACHTCHVSRVTSVTCPHPRLGHYVLPHHQRRGEPGGRRQLQVRAGGQRRHADHLPHHPDCGELVMAGLELFRLGLVSTC